MQAAVDHQLTALGASDPNKRVVVVTFSDEVSNIVTLNPLYSQISNKFDI